MGDEAERRRGVRSVRPREPSGAFDTARRGGTSRVVSMRLKETVSEEDVSRSVERAEETLDRLGRARLMVDCRRVDGYEGDARDRIVKWARTQRDRVDRVAVVTDNVLWQMVLRTSSLASRQSMRGFTDIEDAFDWLGS